jgi:hypothetical protein
VRKAVSVNDLEKPYFGDCKTVYPGSIPGVASILADVQMRMP